MTLSKTRIQRIKPPWKPKKDAAPDEKVAYLTFDDGPSGVTTRLLNVLDDLNVKATFFVAFGGSDTEEKREILKKEVDAGHVVGVHTWTHDYYTNLCE